MIKANTATISLCTSVFSKPNRWVELTTNTPPLSAHPQYGRYALAGFHEPGVPCVRKLIHPI